MEEIFPPEIVTEILIRLPVKSLMRFRCVSKPWCSQIDDSTFIKNHLKYSKESSSNLNVIVSDSVSDYISWVSFDSLYSNLKLNNLSFDSLDFSTSDNPFKDKFIEIIGSRDGLVCCSDNKGNVFLMNPSIRKHLVLPAISTKLVGVAILGRCLFGFGYDPISDDYKVVRLRFYQSDWIRRQQTTIEINVYHLKSNSWREITLDRSIAPYYHQRRGVLLYHTLHWPVTRSLPSDPDNDFIGVEELRDVPLRLTCTVPTDPDLLVGFDLGKEEFRELPMPHIENLNKILYIDLGVVEECLSVFAMYKGVMGLDIWAMKEYGVQESWTRLYSVALNGGASCMRTLAFSKNTDQLLLGARRSEFLCYNLTEEVLKIMDTGIEMAPVLVGTFHESLIPLNSLKEAESSMSKKKRKKEKFSAGPSQMSCPVCAEGGDSC